MLKVTLTSGLVGKKQTHRKVVEALGLGKFGSSAVHADTPVIRGMIRKVEHLIEVQPAADADVAAHTKQRADRATTTKPAAATTTSKASKKN